MRSKQSDWHGGSVAWMLSVITSSRMVEAVTLATAPPDSTPCVT